MTARALRARGPARFPLIAALLLLTAAAPDAPSTTTTTAPAATSAPAPPVVPLVPAPSVPEPAVPHVQAVPTPSAPLVPSMPAPSASVPSAPAPSTPAPSTPAPSPPALASHPAPSEPKLPATVALQKVAPEEAMPILGHRVVGPDGKDIARLVDVLMDANGQPVAAVLDFGGFMGVGSRNIVVHWNALRFAPAEAKSQIALSLTADEIKAAPEYKDPEKPAPVVVPVSTGQKPGPQ